MNNSRARQLRSDTNAATHWLGGKASGMENLMKKYLITGSVLLMSGTSALAAAPEGVAKALGTCCAAIAACCEAVLSCCG